MGPGDGNYDGNRYHKKPILRFGDFTDRFNANRMNRSQYAPGSKSIYFKVSVQKIKPIPFMVQV